VSGGNAVETGDVTAELAPGMGLSIDNPTTFGEDARGELYAGSVDTGRVYKLMP
jgi:hypothetical protein